MRQLLFPLIALIAASTISLADGEGWTTDLEVAKTRAKAENKPIFLYFTGSDWCAECVRMEKEILTKPAFMDYAEEHLVLLEVDFPKKPETMGKQSAELKAQNKVLDKQFKIEGYPTVILADADLKVLAETEFRAGGPEAYVAHLKELLNKADPPATVETKE
jgi:protein disulfide-isomerase